MPKTQFRIKGGKWSDKPILGAVNEVDGPTHEHYFPMRESFGVDLSGNYIPPQYGSGIGIVVRAGEDLKAGEKVFQQEGTTLMYMAGGENRHELGYAGTDVKADQLFTPVPTWLPRAGYPAFQRREGDE